MVNVINMLPCNNMYVWCNGESVGVECDKVET
jgi:hypothetical protein